MPNRAMNPTVQQRRFAAGFPVEAHFVGRKRAADHVAGEPLPALGAQEIEQLVLERLAKRILRQRRQHPKRPGGQKHAVGDQAAELAEILAAVAKARPDQLVSWPFLTGILRPGSWSIRTVPVWSPRRKRTSKPSGCWVESYTVKHRCLIDSTGHAVEPKPWQA
jgi:hypothetical protein